MLELNALYNMHCMDGMRQFSDKFFDLAIVDPPYGINVTQMTMGTHCTRSGDGYPGVSTATRMRKGGALPAMSCDWDTSPPSKEYFAELFRVSKNQIIWGGNYFELPPTRGIVVWDKLQPWESFSQVELAWTSFDRPAAIIRCSNTGGANREKKIHPTQKPIAVYRELLKRFAQLGDIIIDTHTGSASSLIAATEFGLEFVGFEIDAGYCYSASERIVAHRAQTKLNGF